MPQLSPIEILVIIMVALVVFGPEKLPQIARQIGRAASELRRMASEVKDEFQDSLDLNLDDEPEPHPKHPNLINRHEGMDPRLAAAADEDEPKDEPKDEPDAEIR